MFSGKFPPGTLRGKFSPMWIKKEGDLGAQMFSEVAIAIVGREVISFRIRGRGMEMRQTEKHWEVESSGFFKSSCRLCFLILEREKRRERDSDRERERQRVERKTSIG